MSRSIIVLSLAAALLPGLVLAPRAASAAEPGSPACQRELQDMRKKMRESLLVIDSVKDAPAPAKCPAYSAASEMAEEIRETAARCQDPTSRTSAVRDADDVIDAINTTYKKFCPPRPGMVYVKMTMVTRVTRDQLPKPLAALHRCVDDDDTMFSTNERFDLGRLFVLGCPGEKNPAPEHIKARNASPDMLKKEQARVYFARDKAGDDPHLLTFPILTADGREATTDLMLADRLFIGDKLDLISMVWDPAKDGVCRVRAIWRVTDAKPALVLWEEAADCSGSKPAFKAVLDKR